eukprot:GSMAST32.ASY1.ANO1.1440.1 assembled CDS
MRLYNIPSIFRHLSSRHRSFSTILPTVPVTVLSGFLGADKNHGKRIGVLVNDMAEVNIDADLVSNHSIETNMVQLQNGCICCTLRDDLVLELVDLVQQGNLDHIVVESTGISEPLPVAQTFSAPINMSKIGPQIDPQTEPKVERSLNDTARLHSLVTVVDCSTFLDHLESKENLKKLGMSATKIQFANHILLNKIDLVTKEHVKKVEILLRYLNPTATIQKTKQSSINVTQLLNVQSYDETFEEYGINHFSIRIIGRPFHAKRWHSFLNDKSFFDGIFRAKGYFWIDIEPHTRIDYSLVGNTGNNEAIAAAATQRLYVKAMKVKEEQLWHPITHDRRVELVFIGQADKMNEWKMRSAIENCLLTKDELREFMKNFENPQNPKNPKNQNNVSTNNNPFATVPRCVVI